MGIKDGFKFGVGWVLANWVMEAVSKALKDSVYIKGKDTPE